MPRGAVPVLLAAALGLAGPAQAGTWHYSSSVSPLDGARSEWARKASMGTIDGHRALVTVGCDAGRLRAAIVWPVFMGVALEAVTWRVDDAAPRTGTWSDSADGTATYAENPAIFARKLMDGHRLAVRGHPIARGAVEAEFDLTGSGAAIGRVLKSCR